MYLTGTSQISYMLMFLSFTEFACISASTIIPGTPHKSN